MNQYNGSLYFYNKAFKEAEREFEIHKLKSITAKQCMSLIVFWIKALQHPPRSNQFKKLKGDGGLQEIKKPGTQIRLIGFCDEEQSEKFYVVKCIKKKRDKLAQKDRKTAIQRKQELEQLNKGGINWEKINLSENLENI